MVIFASIESLISDRLSYFTNVEFPTNKSGELLSRHIFHAKKCFKIAEFPNSVPIIVNAHVTLNFGGR